MMRTRMLFLVAGTLALVPMATTFANQHPDKSDMQMMKSQKMEKMQAHMKEMRAVLEAVKTESDPKKREAMLHKHAQKMQDMMGMMEEPGMKDGAGMPHKHGDMSAQDKMEMMEMRLSVMEEMMGQMMGHTVEKSNTVHKHKKH